MDHDSCGREGHAPPARRAARLLFTHPVAVFRRLLAEHATPRGLAAAAAFGVVVGASPFVGLHTLLVVFGACRLRLNRLMAVAASQICFPPVVPALCIECGYFLRHGFWLTELSMRTLWSEAPERFWEWLIGSLVVGPALAVAVGAATWVVAAIVQRRSGDEPPPPRHGLLGGGP